MRERERERVIGSDADRRVGDAIRLRNTNDTASLISRDVKSLFIFLENKEIQ